MIRLDATTRKLQAVLAAPMTTANCPITCCYSDKTSSTYTGATTVINSNGSTAVDIVAAPAASTIRDVDYISCRNSDTVPITLTLRYNDNATLYTICTIVLAVGDVLTYTHSNGWHCLDSSGSIKLTFNSGSVTGSGAYVLQTSPLLITPNLGTPSAGLVTNLTGYKIGEIVQIVRQDTGAVATGTTTIPFDDTIPQNTEGTQFLSQSITPTVSGNKILITACLQMSSDTTNTPVTTALFIDSTANALVVSTDYVDTVSSWIMARLSYVYTAVGTSAVTFKVRTGPTTGTITFNGQSSARRMGGVVNSFIEMIEIKQ